MIAYTMVGVTDLERAKAFYNALFAEMGAKIVMDLGRAVVYGTEQGGAMFSIGLPFNEEQAEPGNGTMTAIAPGSKSQVDGLYEKAIALGASDEGAPGPRGDGFYGAYFRDLDGNKLCFCDFG